MKVKIEFEKRETKIIRENCFYEMKALWWSSDSVAEVIEIHLQNVGEGFSESGVINSKPIVFVG